MVTEMFRGAPWVAEFLFHDGAHGVPEAVRVQLRDLIRTPSLSQMG